jgi:hypothetical protein
MAIGFSDRFDFSAILGWELYQVTIDKYHVMFFFEDGHALLNVADRFSFASADSSIRFTYEIYGEHKFMNIDRILRSKIVAVRIVTKDQLDLVFASGDVLSIYDNPKFRSWWFLHDLNRALAIGDLEYCDLTDKEIQERCA